MTKPDSVQLKKRWFLNCTGYVTWEKMMIMNNEPGSFVRKWPWLGIIF